MGKNEKMRKFFWITKRAIRGLQTGAGFRECKLGQEELQKGAFLGISNRGKKITNRGKRNFKSR